MTKNTTTHTTAYMDALVICGLRQPGKDETRLVIYHGLDCACWTDQPCTCGAQVQDVRLEQWLRHVALWN